MTSTTARPGRHAREGSGLVIAVDVVALWGLCAYGSRENLAG